MTGNELRNIVFYKDGNLFYKNIVRKSQTNPIGYINESGYRVTRINGKGYKVHRLVWLYFNDTFPDEIDHINGIRNDNRIENLKNVCHLENMQNRPEHRKGNPVGVRKMGKKWQARIRLNKKTFYLGVYDTIEEASVIYKEASIKLTTQGVSAVQSRGLKYLA